MFFLIAIIKARAYFFRRILILICFSDVVIDILITVRFACLLIQNLLLLKQLSKLPIQFIIPWKSRGKFLHK